MNKGSDTDYSCNFGVSSSKKTLKRRTAIKSTTFVVNQDLTASCGEPRPHNRSMKKTFQLKPEGKHPDRVLEAIKHEIRKYVKRQRRVPLPAGVDFWDFDCRFGVSEAVAASVHFATLTPLMDAVAKDGGDAFYVEILAKSGHRQPRPTVSGAEPMGTTPPTGK